jgi:UDP-GlcNAc:undecaprenyl-phosphate/decaprenyl-phosphate GlcNAc-1-phosphate transferase
MINIVIITIVINILFFLVYKKISTFFNLFDYPDENRKIHHYKISNIGGFVFILNLLFFLIYSYYFQYEIENFIYLASIIFFLIGFLDDRNFLNPKIKLLLSAIFFMLTVILNENFLIKHIVINSLNIDFFLGKYAFFFTILCLMLFLNALNMFDGINGQTGLYLLLIFFVFFTNGIYQKFSLMILVSILIFLYFNFKNKIFLGNAGVWFCSYFIGCGIIKSYNQNIINVELILMLLIFPGIDMFRVFLERIIKKRHPFFPDKNHMHHILLNTFNPILTVLIIAGCYFLPFILFILTQNFILSLLFLLSFYFLLYFKFYLLKN